MTMSFNEQVIEYYQSLKQMTSRIVEVIEHHYSRWPFVIPDEWDELIQRGMRLVVQDFNLHNQQLVITMAVDSPWVEHVGVIAVPDWWLSIQDQSLESQVIEYFECRRTAVAVAQHAGVPFSQLWEHVDDLFGLLNRDLEIENDNRNIASLS